MKMTLRMLIACSVPLLLGFVCSRPGWVDPSALCIDAKLVAAARHAHDSLACQAEAVEMGAEVDPSCLDQADAALAERFSRAEALGGCPTENDSHRIQRLSELSVGRALSELVPDPGTASLCSAAKLRAGGLRVWVSARTHGRNIKWTNTEKLVWWFERLDQAFGWRFARAELLGDCQTTGDEDSAAALFDSGLDVFYGALGVVDMQTVSIPSQAQPADTPGTPGVDANDYPKLVTQLGSSDFSLNNATYTRFFYQPDGLQPDAILILVPGFEGGGASFKILAENLVTRSMENGLRVEVWAYDRRGNQLEDREGVALALAERDPLIALDWYYGAELGLELHPALAAGPNRRAIFHDTQEDTAFIANWTSLVFSRDIDAVVEAARATALHENVFLGGHSMGTVFTAHYAATDFDLSGMGPAEPGFEKLRGLVLLEGGADSIRSPLTEHQLDRIEDRADGGLFSAVWDKAPRCVDGTPCTIATETVDCAGRGNGTCTKPVPAYAVLPGLLNPRILASTEAGAVQGLDDPDGAQVIIQVDQGTEGNNAIAQVPDLEVLGLLPAGTPVGALGTFVDDDGFVSSLAVFVRTSVGAPGPEVDGILTWHELGEGPMPPEVLPYNGPAPTSLPGGEWGQEKEVTRIDRMGPTFVTEGTNFTDWYYPSSGLSVTSELGLDSTQLSVGRGRPDIENLTQAANIDIPVIAFGGTNGLTPVPGSYLAFAQSIGPCMVPSCSGSPRVVDATLPNQAFPSYGGPDGGFEVHLSEGYAHIDIVAAEDDANNNVIGPLIDFLERNLE